VTDDDSHLEPFPLPEHHDTDRSPLPPEEEMPEGKPDRSKMTDRELLLSLHERIDAVDQRLADGDREFQEQKKDIGIVSSAVKALCEVRGLDDKVQELGRRLADRFPANGVGHEAPTNPSNERPESDAE
jgi:hypothetical protein